MGRLISPTASKRIHSSLSPSLSGREYSEVTPVPSYESAGISSCGLLIHTWVARIVIDSFHDFRDVESFAYPRLLAAGYYDFDLAPYTVSEREYYIE
jgi:hypothetical protein